MARESEKWLSDLEKAREKDVAAVLNPSPSKVEGVNKEKKVKPKWGFKTKVLNIELPKYDVATLMALNCGCECIECRKNFTAYWEEKAMTQELQVCLEQEKAATKEILEEVGLMEKELQEQIKELKISLEVERERSRKTEEELTRERKLRMDDVYRRERQDEETKAVRLEQKKTEEHLLAFQEEVEATRKDNAAFKRANESLTVTKERLLRQMQEYEGMLSTLERSNGDMRTKLYELDIENAKLKGKNERLKFELEKTSEQLKSFTISKRTALVRSTNSAPQAPLNLLLPNSSQSSLASGSMSSLQMQLAPLQHTKRPNYISRENSVFSSQTLSSIARR